MSNKRRLTICGGSTARFATWYFIDELDLLLDAGDGVAAGLGSKCQKVAHVFLSHADRDHLGGMIQLNQLAARPVDPPTYYFPRDSGSFPALRDFLERFDPKLARCAWEPVAPGQRIAIGRDVLVEVQGNAHVAEATRTDPALVKSLDFMVIQQRRKLRECHRGRTGAELAALREREGEDHISEVVERRLLGFSGDAPRFDVERWRGTEVLLHEATFIAPDVSARGHCELGEVIRGAAALELGTLVLSHFSSRYKSEDITAAIRAEAARADVAFPIIAVMPGTIERDVLALPPVWAGRGSAGPP